jgi:hypothetical protein
MGEGGSRSRWYRWLPAAAVSTAVVSRRWLPVRLTSWRRGR